MNNVIAFIPARAGSKSIPNKNIKELGGKPLIAWTIETALASGFSRVIVSTDGEDIKKIALQYGAEVMDRPKELAGDKTPMFEVLRSEILKIEPEPEYVALLQPTSPFRSVVHVKTAVNFLLGNEHYDSLIVAERVPEKYNPAQIIISTPSGLRMSNGAPVSQRTTRRQDFPSAWVPTGELYVLKTNNLKQGSMYGAQVLLYEKESEININTVEDWELCEQKLSQK